MFFLGTAVFPKLEWWELIVNVHIDANDLVLCSAALFQLRSSESPSKKFNVCGPGRMYFGQGGMKALH